VSAKKSQPLDLLRVRQQLTALRNQYSEDRRVCTKLNNILVEIAYLNKPTDKEHQERLRAKISKALTAIEKITKIRHLI
jgi:hypothetical protein